MKHSTPDLVHDRFELGRLLGSGMSEVYAATDLEAAEGDPYREVAVKLITLDWARQQRYEFDQAVERFEREIKIVKRLAHPGIPKLIATGFDVDRHQPYFAMELVQGEPLEYLIGDHGDLLPVRAAAGIAGQIAEVLIYTHRVDVLHRDLKPLNVMIEADGRVKVLDFGAGLDIGPEAPTRLTEPGATIGSRDYMSPEQAMGEPLTPRSDLYNLGCLLYQLLTGTVPFAGRNGEQVLYAQVSSTPTPMSVLRAGLPEDLTALVGELLAKDPADRPADASAVAARLRAIAAAAPVEGVAGMGDPADVLLGTAPAGPSAVAVPSGLEVDVFELHKSLISEYRRFTSGGVIVEDGRIKKFIDKDMDAGSQWPDPFVALNPFFESGGRVDELVAEGLLHPACADIFQTGKPKDSVGCDGTPITLHRHQREAIEAAGGGGSYVLTTGTGSGKSLSYILPIVNKVLRDRERHPGTRRVRAIVVYPMNALANSQVEELNKYLRRGYPEGGEPVTFAKYTGQESQADREAIRRNPPDILLTNYVMLELLLTRVEDRKHLIAMAKGLEFLVFDELHTYRGRQGADVAWLIRRVREACEAPNVQCVGTSATMSTEGTASDQKRAVAAVASTLFGVPVSEDRIIGETLVRACADNVPPPTAQRIAAPAAPRGYGDLVADPLAAWIEGRFGIRTAEDGGLIRQAPTTVEDAAEELAEATGASVPSCDEAIRKTLLAGSKASQPGTGRPLFAFRLHQFLSKGDHIYTTLLPWDERGFTRDYQVRQPGTGHRLYPLAFCRDCGKEYLTVVRLADAATGSVKYHARIERDLEEDDQTKFGYLYIDDEKPWPKTAAEAILAERLPNSWLEVDPSGNALLAKSRTGTVPRVVHVDTDGREGTGTEAAFISGRFTFCLKCRITHEAARGQDFGRLAAFNQEGRSSATSVVSTKLVDELRRTKLDDRAKKLLAFVDNRQDASLQAGHFNDFAQIIQLRGALHRALRQSDGGLNDEAVAAAVVTQMSLDPKEYDKNGNPADSGLGKLARRAFEAVVDFHLHLDLRRGWRVTMPNLEQTGQLVIDYHDLDRVTADESWRSRHQALADADPALREKLVRALLDAMRRELAIEVDCLDTSRFDTLQRNSTLRLTEPWHLDQDEDAPEQTAVYPVPQRGRTDKSRVFMSGRGKMGRYIGRTLKDLVRGKLTIDDREQIIVDMLEVLVDFGLVTEVQPSSQEWRPRRGGRPMDITGYRVDAGAFIWKAGSGEHGIDDPLAITRDGDTHAPVHKYFKELYGSGESNRTSLRAKEHTAQVSPEERQVREKAFRDGDLPVLYCSPTMELGVDIAELNAVLMRNVPPTPANYAQRSGRAGRSGQQALVITYCATGNSHDQYYFQRRQQMVAGAVAPPRLDLCNEDLIAAHIHSIYLAEAGFDLRGKIIDLVDTGRFDRQQRDSNTPLPLFEDVQRQLDSAAAQTRTLEIAERLLAERADDLEHTTWWDPEWLERTVRRTPLAFDEAFERWRRLYLVAAIDREEQHDRRGDTSLSPRDQDIAKRRRAEAEHQINLLCNTTEDSAFGADFHPQRYLASEGFLPGYSFPRLPLAAYIPKRSGRADEGDYLQRARFLAVREFGPGALIYHEGRRYEVTRIQLPPTETGDLTLTTATRCTTCGSSYDRHRNVEICELCETPLNGMSRDDLLELRTVYTKPRKRISTDEEERRRAGFVLETSYRFNDRINRPGRADAVVTDPQGKLARLAYGDAATVRVANLRRRAEKDKAGGYWIDPSNGEWISKQQADDAVGSTTELAASDTDTRLKKRVVPYVQDNRNIAVIRLEEAVELDTGLSLMYALERGIEAEFELEDSELAAELPTDRDPRPQHLLFVESAEGGAGVLRRLEAESDALARAARRALEICHFDPATGADLQADTCVQGCYSCLLTYGNQGDHERIDRHKALPLLQRFATAEALSVAAGRSRTDEHRRLSINADSQLERDFVALLKAGGHRLPTNSQVLIESAQARPDYIYHLPGGAYAVFVDGPHHDGDSIAQRDAAAEERLSDYGWQVIRFRYDDDWNEVIAHHRDVFGPGSTRRTDADRGGTTSTDTSRTADRDDSEETA